MSENFRPDRKINLKNKFYTKCITIIIDSIVHYHKYLKMGDKEK